jgi:spoIIIJ-associated protein
VEEVGREAADFIKHVISEIGISDPQVSLTQTGDQEITLNIEGDDLGIIIGRRGETLDALQLITAIAANRQREDGARVILDAENYRERHEDMLRDMASEYAADAKNRGEEVVIPDLKAYERRIVHMALRDDTSVRTYSEGEGRDRVLVISPTDM